VNLEERIGRISLATAVQVQPTPRASRPPEGDDPASPWGRRTLEGAISEQMPEKKKEEGFRSLFFLRKHAAE
jgi:hypothetical protein